MYFKLYDCWGKLIIAYDETWQHAISNHQELINHEPEVMRSLINPQGFYQSDTSTQTKLYVGPAIEKGIYAGETPVSVVRYDSTQGTWVTGYFGTVSPHLKKLWP